MARLRGLRTAFALLGVLGIGAGASAQGINCADTCAEARVLNTGANPFDLESFTNDFPATCGASANAPDGWWTYTATQDGTLTASTCGGTRLDTVLAWLSSCGGPQLGCLDDSCGAQTSLSIAVTAGQTCKLRIAGFNGAAGSGTLTASFTPAPCSPGFPLCRCDFNRDAVLNSQDLFDYLACFFGECPGADFNCDAQANSQDFFDFLVCFLAPPPGCGP